MARTDLHFRLRIPPDLKVLVEESALANHRSMTAEIIARLESTFPQASAPKPTTASIAVLPDGINAEDFAAALERSSDELLAITMRRLGISVRPVAEEDEG